MIRSRSGSFGRPRPASRTTAETSAFLTLLMAEPLPDRHAGEDEDGRCEEPGDEALRHGSEVPERPAAAVVRVLRVLDVGDDRVELVRRERLLREARHHIRPYA